MSREFYVPCQPYAYPKPMTDNLKEPASNKSMSSEGGEIDATAIRVAEVGAEDVRASAPRSTMNEEKAVPVGPPVSPVAGPVAESSSGGGVSLQTAAEPGCKSEKRPSAFSSFTDRIRNRLSSRDVGRRLKSLVRWRSLRVSSKSSTGSSLSANTQEVAEDLGSADAKDEQSEENNETNAFSTEAEASKSSVQYSVVESHHFSLTSGSGTSSFSPVESQQSHIQAPPASEEVSSSTVDQSPNAPATAAPEVASSDTATNPADSEANSPSFQETLTVPSGIYGVQIDTAVSLGARMLDGVVPIVYIESYSAPARPDTTTATEESIASNSSESSPGAAEGSDDNSGSSGVIELLASTLGEAGRRFDADYARPYYDHTVRPRIRKQVRRLDEDPPIF